MSDCPRFGKWIRACRFEPRFSISPGNVTAEQIKALDGMCSSDCVEAIKAIANAGKRYVFDVCTRCGRIAAPPCKSEE